MADNTDEVPLDKPTSTQPVITTDDIIPTQDTQSINPNKETENMEVHKHLHHVSHKKKWGEYLLEFFMLFLAVFLGFVAENIREETVEKHRETQYMESLINDLSADTAMFSRGIQRKEERINAIDSVFIFFKEYPDAKIISGKFFKTLRRTSYDQLLIRNTITINQLKNAGGMRLIKNKYVTDSISSYDFQCAAYEQYNVSYLTHQALTYRNLEKIVNATDMLALYEKNTSEGMGANVPDTLVIRINNKDLNEELNFWMQVKLFARQEAIRFKDLKRKANNLMALIKKEYSLENE